MLFTIVLFALATAGPVFSAPVPSTELTLRQESADAVVKRGNGLHGLLPNFTLPPLPKPSSEAPPSGSGDSITPSLNPSPVDDSPSSDETGVGPAVGSGDVVGDLEDPAEDDGEDDGENDGEDDGEDDGDEGISTILDLLPKLH